MEEIGPAARENLLISAYWSRRNVEEMHIGYGMRKDTFSFQIVGIFYSLVAQILKTFVEPRVRPIVRPLMRMALWLLPTLVIGLLVNRGNKATGFYQLDDEGRPIQFLSNKQPESIQGRRGVGRKRFLNR